MDELGGRAVVKADGLAAGKGVTVALERATAETALRDCLEGGAFGEAGATVVVEEVLEGPEVSAFAVSDGTTVVPLVLVAGLQADRRRRHRPQHRRAWARTRRCRTVDADTEAESGTCAARTVDVMAKEGVTYRGLLYAGLMLTADGPKVLEYNCRFGDPETEVVIPRLASDLAELLEACATGRPRRGQGRSWRPEAAVTVVLASGGYPGAYETGVAIEGLDEAGVDGGRGRLPRGHRGAGR